MNLIEAEELARELVPDFVVTDLPASGAANVDITELERRLRANGLSVWQEVRAFIDSSKPKMEKALLRREIARALVARVRGVSLVSGERQVFQINGHRKKIPVPFSIRCPRCRQRGIFPGFEGAHDIDWPWRTDDGLGGTFSAGMRQCPDTSCGALVFVVYDPNRNAIVTYPSETLDFDPSGLPKGVLSTLEEAIRCHGAGAYRAAAIMVRRVLEELCENKDAKGSSLAQKIESLSNTVTLSAELLDAAHELRLLGNDAAHVEAKVYNDIGRDEVEAGIDLAKELLKGAYQHAQLVNRLKSLKKPIAEV